VDIDGGHLHLYDCFWDWLNDHDLTDIVEKLGGTIGTAELPAPDWED
jgi:hypothetical protein